MVKRWVLAGAVFASVVVTLALLGVAIDLGGSHTSSPTALYDIVGANGSVYNFGVPGSYGSLGGKRIDQPIVGIAVTPGGKGYWLAGAGGTVYPFGDARSYGSMGSTPLSGAIVGMAATSDGLGYWLVASDGGIFAFGDAAFHGSMGGKSLAKPIVGMATTSDGNGYWLVASDGGVFSFGDAGFHGSMGGKPLNRPMVGITAAPGGNGYWLVASDGGVFSFNAPFYGSMGGKAIGAPVVGIASAQESPRSPPPPPPPPPTTLAPSIGSFVASSTLPAKGGTSELQWSTSNATSCTVSASPAVSGADVTVPCSDNGTSVVVPADSKKRPITYTFTLEATGSADHDATAQAQTTVQGASPSIDSFRTPVTVQWSGGTADVQWSTTDASSCTVSASPGIAGLPATVPCSKGAESVTIHANSGTKEVDYTFKLDARGPTAPDATATSQTMLKAPPKLLITASPNPLVETGAGDIEAVVQVSTTELLAGARVNISSTELDASCKGGVTFTSIAPGVTAPVSSDPIQVTLDGDGNAAVVVSGDECAAGNWMLEADLAATPFYSALTTLDVVPPQNTTHGVVGYPSDEVVTGNTTASGESDMYAVFNVEAPSVYAEQYVEIQANELVDRCGEGSYWVSNQGMSETDGTVAGSSTTWTAQLDDNGNAVFEFFGASCASGTSTVLADVEAGLHPSYSDLLTILSPRNIVP
jgi:hypothetical protein